MTLSRRRLVLGGAALGGAVALDAFGIEPRWLEVSEHDVPVAGLPSALDGFRIAQVSDAHLKELGRVENAIVAAVRRANAQLVVLTGDIVDSERALAVTSELVPALRDAGADVVATLGNWEHWQGFDARHLADTYRRLGARLLVNEVAVVRGVVVAGTDDGYAGALRWDRTYSMLESVLGSGAPRLLLTHSPASLDLVPAGFPRFDLALAGHTHGGQIRLGPFAPLVPPGSGRFVKGRYTTPAGTAYVSRGTGTSIISARFACRPELPIFRLSSTDRTMLPT